MLTAAYSAPPPLSSGVPFGLGGTSTDLVPNTFPVAIGGHAYLPDWTKYERQTVEAQRPAFDNQAEPGETTLNPQQAWRRSQSRFDLGAGQSFFDDEQSDVFPTRRFASTRQRYYASKGINPWDDNGIRLLPATEQISSSASTNLKVLVVGGYLYRLTNTSLIYSGTGSGTATLPAAARTITTDGTSIYVAYGSGEDADKLTIGSTTVSAFGTNEPSILAYANGRMIAAESSLLWEYDNLGAHIGTALADPDFGGTWVDVLGTPVGIFAALNVGSARGELYFIGVDADTGGLLPARFAGRLLEGETFNCLYFYGGAMIAGTSRGFRVFTLTGNDSQPVEMQSVVPVGSVTALAGYGDFVYFSWSNYDTVSTGIGRANIARSTDPDSIIPPYASDLMVTGQGAVTSIAAQSDGTIVFAVSGLGFYQPATDDELVTSGTFDSGWVRYGSLIDKAFSGVELVHDPLDGEIQVDLLPVQTSTATTIGTSTSAGATASDLFGTQIRARAVRVQLTLTRDEADDTAGPVLRAWTLLANPAPKRADEIVMPIVMTDAVEGLDGSTQYQDVLAEYEYLYALSRSGQFVTLQEYDRTETVIVTQVLLPQSEDREGAPTPVQDTRRWTQGLWLVRMLTKEA